MDDVITRYLDCWNEADPAKRRRLIEDVWAVDARYIDPIGEARGRDAIDATIAAAQEHSPACSSRWPDRWMRAAARRASPGT